MGWRWLDQVWTGMTDIGGGAASFVTDVADASIELGTGDLGGAAEIFYTSVQEDLMGRVLGGAFGPEGIIGTGIEALPDFIREPGAAVLMPTMEAWQWTIDEVVDRPLGTIATVLNATGANGIHELFDLDTYTAAYRINDGRTFGQSAAAAIFMINPFDEDEYNSISDDPLFNVISGTADFIQEFLDPIQLAGSGALGLARGSMVTARVGRNGSRILTPTRVLGGGTGIRPLARKPHKRATWRFKTSEQAKIRDDILGQYTTARTDHFIETPRWKTVQREMDAATSTAGQYEALNRMLGRGGAKMPEQAKVAISNGRTAEARNLTLRALAGDIKVHAQVQTVGTAFKAEWLDDSARMERVTEYNFLRRELDEDATRVRVAGEEAVDDAAAAGSAVPGIEASRFTDETRATKQARLKELEEEGIAFNNARGAVDWETMYDLNRAVFRSQQRRVVAAGDHYEFDSAYDLTMNSMDDTGLFAAALEDIIESAEAKRPLSGGISSGTRAVAPYGRGLTRLKEKNQRYLERSGRTSMVDEYRNPNTVGGHSRTIRVFTEKVPQSHIDFRDAVNPYTQFERALTQASRVVVDGERLIGGTEVGEIMGRFAAHQAAGEFDQMMGLYDRVTQRLMDDFDAVSPAEFKELREQYRAANQMWESASEPQRALGVNNVDGIAVEADVVVHLPDESIVTTRKIHPDDKPKTVLGSATSTSQVHTTRVLPRWDLVSRELQKYQRRANAIDTGGLSRITSGALDVAEKTQRRVGAAGSVAMSIWRPAILLTPKWPMRVGFDEQLRIASQLGTMETLRLLVRSMPDLSRTMAAKSMARKGRGIDSAGDLTHITSRIDEVLEKHGIGSGTGIDLAPRLRELEAWIGKEAAEKELKGVYSKLLDEQLKESRRYRSSVAAVKGLALSTVIAPPVGFIYAGLSFASRRRRIVQAGRQRAALSMGDALQNEGRRLIREAVDNPALAADAEQMIRRGESINDFASKIEPGLPAEIKDVLTKADERLADGGLPMLKVGNNRVRGAYGDNVSDSERLHRATSSSNSLGHIYRGANADNARQVEKFRRTDWTRWDVLEHGADHGERFARMVELYTTKGEFKPFYDILWRNTNDVPAQADDLAKLLASDEALRRRLGFNRASDDQLLDIAEQLIDEYNAVLPPGFGFDELRAKAFDGGQPQWSEVNAVILTKADEWGLSRNDAILRIREDHPGFGRAISPDASSPSSANPRTQLADFVDEKLESMFDTLGTQVSDNVARSPYYSAKYDAEVTRRIQNHIDDTGNASLTQKTLDAIEADARKGALADTRTLLYDLAEDTRFGELMTNLMPFYNAWGEVISRWGGMAVDNPYFVANSYRLYSKPWNAETLGITEVTDEESGSSYLMFRWHNPTQDPDSEGVRTVFDVMSPAVRNLLIPKPMQDPDRTLRFSKDGLASMLQSTTPGFGPLVTVPVREAVLANPTLETTFEFMFPFGHPEGGFLERAIKDSAPTWAKSVDDLLRDSHTNERVVQSMFVDYAVQRQEAGDPIDAGDILDVNNAIDIANERANQFHVFRVAAGLFSPTSATALSPYAPLIKIARELQQEHGTLEGNQIFLAEYGEDLFALSARMTQLNDGVAAAIESEELYADHQKLVQGHPSIGGWVTESLGGTDEQFAFSQAAYRRQRNMEISPSDDRNRRERKTPTETIAGPARELGWAEYTKLSDAVRTEQAKAKAAGLPSSLNANSMAGLAKFKSDQILILREKYPEWAEQLDDFGRSSRGMQAVVDGFMAGLQNPDILARPSSVHVIEYFQLRQAVQNELVRLKSVGLSDNLDATSNDGLRLYFEEEKAELGDRPEFSAIYDRYFERDTLQRPTFADDGAFQLEFV